MSFPLAEFRASVVRSRPERIEALYTSNDDLGVRGVDQMNPQHCHSENMEWWCSEAEISGFIADTNRVNKLLSELGIATQCLGMKLQRLGIDQMTPSPPILMSACMGCNTPYDNGGCSHGSIPPRRERLDNADLTRVLHTASVTVDIASHLLIHGRQDADRIVQLILDREPEFGMTKQQVVEKLRHQLEIGMPDILSALLGLVDNCSFAFPKLVQKSMGLMSLVVCRYPARSLGSLDHNEFVRIIYEKYMLSVFELIHNSECRVEERYGIVAFINVLPALYHFGNWRMAHRSPHFSELVAGFTSAIINVCHSATCSGAEDSTDVPLNLEKFPELAAAKVLIEPLLVDPDDDDTERRQWRVKVLRERPMSFLVASGLEVVGWWAYKGVDWSQAQIPGNPGEIATVQSSIAEYLPRIRQLVSRTPSLAYMGPLAEALARGDSHATALAPLVKRRSHSLLYGPLMDANRRCGYCREPQSAVNGKDLLRCGGGCGEMEQYCCKEHQVEHWKSHKAFCKANKRAY